MTGPGTDQPAAFRFADIAGFTALTEAHGDEEAATLVADFCAAVKAELPAIPAAVTGYRGSSAIGASVELGFGLAQQEDDDDPDRRFLQAWKCRPAPRPPTRWLRLSTSNADVFVERADPPTSAVPRSAAPVVGELMPRVQAVIGPDPQTRADIARSVGRSPKDRSVGRVLRSLEDRRQVERVDRGYRRVAGEQHPLLTMPPRHPGQDQGGRAENAGGTGAVGLQVIATPEEERELARVRAKEESWRDA